MRETEDFSPSVAVEAPLPLGIVPSPPLPGLWLQFQPVVWLESQAQEPYFLEALLRLGAHAPAQALARYRERGELHRLTLAVLEGALAEGARRGRAVSVNLSPAQLGHPRLRADLRALLRAFGFSAQLAKTPGSAYLLRLGGESLERVDAFIRERLYWWDVGLVVERMAGGEADHLVPTAFELNPLRPLPPEAAWARPPLAEEPLYARPVLTFREAQGRGLEPGAWGI